MPGNADSLREAPTVRDYEAFKETIPVGFYKVDEEGNIVEANARTAEALGFRSKEDLEGKNLLELVERGFFGKELSDLVAEADQDIGQIFAEVDEEVVEEDYEIYPGGDNPELYDDVRDDIDAEEIYASSRLRLRESEDGEYNGLLGAVRDITERKKREEELERKNRRLEHVMEVFSHDLRNPLTVAMGRLELIDDGEHVEKVAGALDRVSQILEAEENYIQDGRRVEDYSTVDIESIARSTWNNVDTKEAELSTEEYILEADDERLKHVFENLYSNAVKHGGEDVLIEVGPMVEDEGFYVQDDGVGIPDSEKDQVFDYRNTFSEEGAGLGLYHVREIAEAHEWELDLEDSPKGGARFEFYIE